MQIQVYINNEPINILTSGWKLYENNVLLVLSNNVILQPHNDGFDFFPYGITNSVGTVEKLKWFAVSSFLQESTATLNNFDIVSINTEDGLVFYIVYNNAFYALETGNYYENVDPSLTYTKHLDVGIGLNKPNQDGIYPPISEEQ